MFGQGLKIRQVENMIQNYYLTSLEDCFFQSFLQLFSDRLKYGLMDYSDDDVVKSIVVNLNLSHSTFR